MSTDQKVIRIENVSKIYGQNPYINLSVFTILDKFFKKNKKTFQALTNVNMYCNKGEIVGIIGQNGSGKSTLLKVISNLTSIDTGDIDVQGRVVSLLEVGAGFSMLLTGRENIYLNVTLFGISKKQIEDKIDKIIDFAGLREFIDTPLYQYSSGMYMRLGFSIAIHCDPDILIVDETFAVGDTKFQSKCVEAIENLKKEGKTILLVSHDLTIVAGICDRIYLLEKGRVTAHGEPEEIVSQYLQFISTEDSAAKIVKGDFKYAFNDGNLIIFYKNAPITKLYGFYSSIFAYRSWHDSQQASWKILEMNPHKLVVEGHSRRLPVVFKWVFDFIDDGQFTCEQFLTLKSELAIDEIQTSILLGKDFSKWQIGVEKGEFPAIPKKAWNDWQHLNQTSSGSDTRISALAEGKNIQLHFDKIGTYNHQPTAIITSKDYNSNVLQFLNIEHNKTSLEISKETSIFKSQITIQIK